MSEEEDFLILLDELIDELDEEYDSRLFLYGICGINGDDFNPNRDILTMRILESHLDEIVNWVEDIKSDAIDNPFFGSRKANAIHLYYVLAILIFETGSAFPDKVREEILNNKIDWMESMEVVRFRERVRSHIPGKPLKKKILELREKLATIYYLTTKLSFLLESFSNLKRTNFTEKFVIKSSIKIDFEREGLSKELERLFKEREIRYRKRSEGINTRRRKFHGKYNDYIISLKDYNYLLNVDEFGTFYFGYSTIPMIIKKNLNSVQEIVCELGDILTRLLNDEKISCTSCGTKNKYMNSYCQICGLKLNYNKIF